MSRRREKQYDDDDGRTISDMSGTSGPGLILPRKPPSYEFGEGQQSSEETPMAPKERRGMVWMALRAGLLIGLAFLIGIGLLIALLLFLWK